MHQNLDIRLTREQAIEELVAAYSFHGEWAYLSQEHIKDVISRSWSDQKIKQEYERLVAVGYFNLVLLTEGKITPTIQCPLAQP